METFIYIIKSITVLSIFYGIYRIVLQKDTFFSANRHYLLSGIIAALIIPFIQYTKTIYRDIPIVSTATVEDAFFTPIVDAIDTQPIQETTVIDWWQIALIIYTVGFVIMIVRLLTQLISLHKLINAYPKTHKEGYTYVQITDKPITPFSFFKTICYNPNLHSPEELDMILAHEKIHVRQRHTLDILLTQCILAIQWFNPFAWLYKKSLEQNLEFIADSGAIREVSSSQEYQRTLVKVSSTILQPALTNNFYHSLIKKRIVMLNKQTSRKRNLWKLGLVLPLLALFMYSFNIKEVIEYREVTLDTEYAFAKAETEIIHKDNTKVVTEETPITNNLRPNKTEVHTPKLSSTNEKKQFVITKESTDQQLKQIESYFKNTFESTRVRFTKVNHIANQLVSFDFQTKMANDNRFFTRFSVANTKNLSSFSLVAAAEHEILKMDEDGSKIKFTPEQSLTTFSTFQEPMGDNPALVVNGNVVHPNSNEITYESEEAVHLLKPSRAIALYGSKAKDGAIVINDPKYTTKVNGKYLRTPKSTTPSEDVVNLSEKKTPLPKFKIHITKNTTDQELEKIKKDLTNNHGVTIEYKTTRNSNNEITAITIKYKTAKNNSGNYSVNGDSPISDVYIFEDEDGTTGIGNSGSRKEMLKKIEERKAKIKARREEMKARREEMKEVQEERKESFSEMKETKEQQERYREELQERMEKKQQELEKRKQIHEERIAERRELIEEKREEKREELEEKREKMLQKRAEIKRGAITGYDKINGETVYYIQRNGQKEYYDRYGNRIDKEGNQLAEGSYDASEQNLFITSSPKGVVTNVNRGPVITSFITKTTTNEELKNIQASYANDGIKFSYKNLKRNKQGEITGITLKLSNNNGNKTSSTFKSNTETISMIYIGYTQNK